MCEAAVRHGISLETALAGCSNDLVGFDDEVTVEDEATIARNVLAVGVDDLTFGMEVGRSASLSDLGLFGFAALSSPNLREFLEVGLQFFGLTCMHVDVEWTEHEDDVCEIAFDASAIPDDLRTLFVALDLAAVARLVPTFAGDALERHADRIILELSAGIPGTLVDLVAATPLRDLRHGRPRTAIRLPTQMLDEPLPRADERIFRSSVARCTRLVARSQEGSVSARVRSLLVAVPGDVPNLEEVAAELGVHPRTLRRRLSAEGATFRDLANETRAILARELLIEVGLNVDQVSRRLGYAEPSAFTHAFVRWYGVPPSTFREATRPARPR
jgi:AraC-like DNA-binding protein